MGTGNMQARAIIYEMINRERDAQDLKWKRRNGEWDSEETKKLTVLVEEVGEAAQEVLRDDPLNLVRELVQVGAVTVAWLESEGTEYLQGISDFDAENYEPDPELKVLREVYAAAADLRAEILMADYGAEFMHTGSAGRLVNKLDDALDKYDLLERQVKE